MATIDVISWESNKNELCSRYNSDNIKDGATLVVHESQTAFFVEEGRIKYELNTPGSRILSTQNYPLLNSLRNIPYGGVTPHKAEVWFINQVSIPGLYWGTPTPIQLEDPNYRIIVPVRAYGRYGIRVVEPRLFLESLIGNMPSLSTNSIGEDFIKPYIIQGISEALSRRISLGESSILNISNELSSMSSYSLDYINRYVKKYGVVVTDFNFVAISAAEDSLQRLSDAKMRAAEIKIISEAKQSCQSTNSSRPCEEYWSALINNREVRDLTTTALMGLLLAQVINGNTMLKRQDANEGWYRVSEIKELASML